MKIAMVAGEYSGDWLAADLIRALKEKVPDLEVYGVAGPKMIEAGCRVLYPIERLAVMGLIEPLKRLPSILAMRRSLRKEILQNRPDVFIGIDSPDFNLALEQELKEANIPVVHYVSPTVWAWRPKRIHKIKKAVDLMLALFPFEEAIYQEHHIPVHFVGHPMADHIPLEPDTLGARKALGLPESGKILALLPGSRRQVIRSLAKDFILTAERCLKQNPDLQIVAAIINDQRRTQFEKILKTTAPQLPIFIIEGHSHQVIEASDVVLLAAGTTALEAMLYQKPMVVAYRLPRLVHFILKHFIQLPRFSLPNLLAGTSVVPEFLQEAVNPVNLSEAVLKALNLDAEQRTAYENICKKIHLDLKLGTSQRAAEAILKLVRKL